MAGKQFCDSRADYKCHDLQ